MVPEIVVFDLGKVLVDFDYGIAAEKIAARGKMPAAGIKAFIDQSPLLWTYESGQLTNDQFFKEVCATTGFCGLMDEFSRCFADIFTAIPQMIEAQGRLHARGVPTCIFSNTNELAVTHIRRTFPFFANFDAYFFSYERCVMKPDPKFYQAVEKVMGRSGRQILYLDDRLENVQTGIAQGWQVIHHQSPKQSIAEMRKLGLLG